MCLQDIDYTGLRPVRYQRLGHAISGLCVSGPWLIVTDLANVSLYSLPDLQLHHQVRVYGCRLPRAESDGRVVYVPALTYITVIEISDSGNMTVIRNITTVGGQSLLYPAVAVGPQPGQLCVARVGTPRLWVVNVSDGSVLQNVTLPDCRWGLWSVAALNSGQLLVSYQINRYTYSLAWYNSVTDSPILVNNVTSMADFVHGIQVSGDHFLAPYIFKANLLVLGTNGSVLHTVDAVSGKLGVWLYGITDVAVWQDCVWLGSQHSDLVLLCAD